MQDVSESLGIGMWHVPIIMVTLYRGIPSAMLMMAINFAAPKISLKCLDGNATAEERCWNNVNATGCTSWEYDHSVFSRTMTEEWELICDRSWLRSMSQSLYLGGMLFGNLIFAHVSDRYGRRLTVVLTGVLMLCFGVCCALSPTLVLYNISRFIVGLGTGGIQSTAITLFVETVPSKLRTLLVATYGIGWTAGQLGLVGTAYLIRDWRYLQMTISLVTLPIIAMWWFLPESPRWLLTKNRVQEADRELQRAASMNKLPNLDISAIVRAMEKKAERDPKRTANLTDLLRGRKLRRYTLTWWCVYFSHRLLYFHLSFASALLGGDIFVNYAIVQSMELPAKALSMVAVRYFRRRATLITCFIIGAASFLFALAFPRDSIVAKVATSAVSMLFMSSALDMMNVYAAEVFPTVLRTVGVGSAYMASRVGSTAAPFLASIGSVTPYGIMQATVGSIQCLVAVALIFMPETLHRPLPDTLQDAEESSKCADTAVISPSTPIFKKDNAITHSEGDVSGAEAKNGLAETERM